MELSNRKYLWREDAPHKPARFVPVSIDCSFAVISAFLVIAGYFSGSLSLSLVGASVASLAGASYVNNLVWEKTFQNSHYVILSDGAAAILIPETGISIMMPMLPPRWKLRKGQWDLIYVAPVVRKKGEIRHFPMGFMNVRDTQGLSATLGIVPPKG